MADDANLFRRYLLGELDEKDQETLEQSLITSDEHFQELLIAEEELVDDFCEGTLSPSEEERYRRHFLATRERRDHHRFGAALRKYLSAPVAPDVTMQRPVGGAWRPALAAAAVALLAAGIWWILQAVPLRIEPVAEGAEGSTVAYFLPSGNLRSAEPATEPSFTVPPGVDFVDLQLEMAGGARGDYEVQIEKSSDGLLAEGTLPVGTIEGQSVVVARVASKHLTPGEYRVVVRAVSTEGAPMDSRTYEFRIESP